MIHSAHLKTTQEKVTPKQNVYKNIFKENGVLRELHTKILNGKQVTELTSMFIVARDNTLEQRYD